MPDKETTSTENEQPTNGKKYRVLAENGLFKNGKQYKKGSLVELTDAQAKAFMNEEVLGEGRADVEEAK